MTGELAFPTAYGPLRDPDPEQLFRTRIEDVFAEQAARTPDEPAVTDGSSRLSYDEVDRESSGVADRLAAAGVRAGDPVGISMARSPRLPVVVLGVLKAGAAYVPLDASYPGQRLAFMAEEAGLRHVVTDEPSRLSQLPDSVRTLTLDAGVTAEGGRADSELSPDATAYIIFTSGSTGRPKGVAMPHRPLVRLLQWHREQPALRKAARTLQFTPLSFDVSFQEIFSTWAVGGCLVTVGEQPRRDPFALLEHMLEHRVQRLFLPFVALDGLCQAICRERPRGLALRDVITAGEQLRITPAIREAFGSHLGARLHNHYGPSETHVVTAHTLSNDPSTWPLLPPIGRAAGGARLFILNDRGLPVPEGDVGEVFVGGTALAHGYVNRHDLTAERFREIPTMGRVYRTGDLVRSDLTGVLEFVGRVDDQVKINGYRVEPGEVEAAIGGLEGVAQAAVVVERSASGHARLAAHVVVEKGVERDIAATRRSLADVLPSYLVPGRFVTAESLPLTPSGKVDRIRLSTGAVVPEPRTGSDQPHDGDDTLTQVLRIHQKVLGLADIGPDDNFFDLGGNSLTAVQVTASILDVHGVRVPAGEVFAAVSIAEFAERVASLGAQSGSARRTSGPGLADPSGDLTTGRASMLQEMALLSSPRAPFASTRQLHVAYRLRGPVDAGLLHRALRSVIDHHPSLRASFTVDDGTVYQHVRDTVPPDLRILDLAGEPFESREARAREVLEAEARRGFDGTSGSLMRVILLRCAERDHFLLLLFDHLVADGWSLNLIGADLGAAYSAHLRGEPPRLRPTSPYLRWSQEQWERVENGRIDQVADFWSGRIGADPDALMLRLPGYRSCDVLAGPSSVTFDIPAETVAELDRTARALRSTPYCLTMAALKVLISCDTGKDRITLHTSSAGRADPAYENTVGWYATSVFPTSVVDVHADFRSAAGAVREAILGATAHDDIPSSYVRRRLWPGRRRSNKKSGVYFIYNDVWGSSLVLDDVTVTPVLLEEPPDTAGLQFWLLRDGDSLGLTLMHHESEYDRDYVRDFGRRYLAALDAVLGDVDGTVRDVVGRVTR